MTHINHMNKKIPSSHSPLSSGEGRGEAKNKVLPGVKSSSIQSLDSLGFQSGKKKGFKNGTPAQAFF
jgi:hypothetical protein